MTRIIGGTAGGRRLRTPVGDATRPTSDRVREALFSALESRLGSLSGLAVLDLYAGSGAVGLEAVSRGAAYARLVEHDRRTARLISTNAADLGFTDRTAVTARTVAAVVAGVADRAYDVVFADPPYDVPTLAVDEVLVAVVAGGWLAPDALVVVERSKRGAAPRWPEGLEPLRPKAYGETTLHWAQRPALPGDEQVDETAGDLG